jgi:two-component system chemotaxis response regulator CheY
MAKKILVVDDSSSIRAHLAQVLIAAGYEALEAGDGREGLEKVRSNPDLALVLCDVHMPNLGGLDMVRMLRAVPANTAVPILMLTAESDPAVVASARTAGVRGWIVKPVKPELLVATVRKVIGV